MTHRVASLLALSGWAGFCGVSALRCVHEAGLSELLFGSFGTGVLDTAEFSPLGVDSRQLLGLAAILAALAVAFSLSIAGVIALMKRPERLVEPFAAATFSALFGFYAALALSGSPAVELFGKGPLVTLFIALGFAGLLFDHLIADQEDAEGDETFQAVMAHLEEAKRAAIAERESGKRRDGDEE
ncbi:hypothetical protein E3C22_03275 [Jiella endophytica]|uniref:Uncharacterized protein n=1 Tax=Jiella endophytica TaxID=2558362 RepID=A0A4Y8RVL1_9HYPH|nr:hypothetical protein [Jiella endophytica]TFF27494.1 hypothetical protein E3C22_03275 [Jiella endophytica]